jgi:hypothetical protein
MELLFAQLSGASARSPIPTTSTGRPCLLSVTGHAPKEGTMMLGLPNGRLHRHSAMRIIATIDVFELETPPT